VVQLSSLVFSLAKLSAMAIGATAAPRRHPVIANFLENVYRMTVRSCMPGNEAMDVLSPE
jgi:hypothetical protein